MEQLPDVHPDPDWMAMEGTLPFDDRRIHHKPGVPHLRADTPKQAVHSRNVSRTKDKAYAPGIRSAKRPEPDLDAVLRLLIEQKHGLSDTLAEIAELAKRVAAVAAEEQNATG